jgi:hypothetical protein
MMPSTLIPSTSGPAAEALERAGFITVSPTTHRHGELCLNIGAHWCVFETPARSASGPGGLWKQVGTDADVRWLASIPRRNWEQGATDEASFDGERTALDECLQWLLDTLAQPKPPEWQPPPRAEIESWFNQEHLTVIAGSLLRQGEVIHEPNRLTIRFELIPEIPPDLAEARLAWLRLLLDEAQERWHLVRCGVITDDDGLSSAVAEVDLTGVPHALAEDLFVLSLEALRWVVQWLGETTDWLADATVASELLAVCPDQQP